MKVLGAILLGISYVILLNYAFYIAGAYSPIITFLGNIEGLNEHHSVYFLVALHDLLIVFLVCFFILFGVRALLPQLEMNHRFVSLFQLPIALFTLFASGLSLDFDSTRQIADIILSGFIITSGFLMLFLVNSVVSKAQKQ